MMQRYKSLVLPLALVLGILFRHICAMLSVSVPYVIFVILLLTFSGVKVAKIRPTMLDLRLALFQTFVSIGIYWILWLTTHNQVIAQGAMICILCPVASSVTVVASILGADPKRTTTYTIIGNLLVAVIAPVYITMINHGEGNSILDMFLLILSKITIVIALPVVVVYLIQRFLPKVNEAIARYKSLSFYFWAYALLITIGQTADFAIARWQEDYCNVLWLSGISMIICFVQFRVGWLIGKHYGDTIGGGQLLGQKNSAMGIWIVNSFLNPVASVSMAFYSIWQNLFNSWQLLQLPKNKP